MTKRSRVLVVLIGIVALWCVTYFRPVFITAQAADAIAMTYAKTQDPIHPYTIYHTDLQRGFWGRSYFVQMGIPEPHTMIVSIDVWTGKVLSTVECCG